VSLRIRYLQLQTVKYINFTVLFVSTSGISELDCATTKTDRAEISISLDRESLQVFFLYYGPWCTCRFHRYGVVVTKNGVHCE